MNRINEIKDMFKEMGLKYNDKVFAAENEMEGGGMKNLPELDIDSVEVVAFEYETDRVEGTIMVYPAKKAIEFGDGPNLKDNFDNYSEVEKFIKRVGEVADKYGYKLIED